MNGASEEFTEAIASFVVARVPGEGYRITSSEGPRANELEPRVLPILQKLGQSSTTKSEAQIYWVGPAGNSHEWVGIQCRVLDSGTKEYYQSWFRAGDTATAPGFGLGFLVASCLMSFVVAVVIMALLGFRFANAKIPGITQDNQGQGAIVNSERNEGDLVKDKNAAAIIRLQTNLAKNSFLREQLTIYLSQDGFAFDPSLPVVEEKRSVKITSDLDRSPPGQESIKLSNFQVQQLLELLSELAACEEESVPVTKPLQPANSSNQK